MPYPTPMLTVHYTMPEVRNAINILLIEKLDVLFLELMFA